MSRSELWCWNLVPECCGAGGCVSDQGGKVAGETRPRCRLSDQGTGRGVAVWATPLMPSACALPSVQQRSHVQSSAHTMRSSVEGDGV